MNGATVTRPFLDMARAYRCGRPVTAHLSVMGMTTIRRTRTF